MGLVCNINGNARDYILGICGVFIVEVEKLKVIAEGMPDGRPVEIEDGCVWYMNYPPTTGEGYGVKVHAVEFNPLTNNDQLVEIMERLEIDLEHSATCSGDGVYAFIYKSLPTTKEFGKTINEAVCAAAYEYFKGLK